MNGKWIKNSVILGLMFGGSMARVGVAEDKDVLRAAADQDVLIWEEKAPAPKTQLVVPGPGDPRDVRLFVPPDGRRLQDDRRIIYIEQAPHRVVEGPRAANADPNAHPQANVRKVTFLGVMTSAPSPELAEQLDLAEGIGLVIQQVSDKSPAQAAGLKKFDLLHKVDGQVLVNAQQLHTFIRSLKPGKEVKLSLIRKGKPMEVSAKLEEREETVRSIVRVLPGGGEGQFQVVPMPDQDPMAKALREDIRKRMKELDLQNGKALGGDVELNALIDPDIERIKDLIDKQMKELRNQLGQEDGAFLEHSEVASVSMSDDTHSLTLEKRDGKTHLTAKLKTGKTLFEGFVNNAEDEKKIPAEVTDKYAKLKADLNRPTGKSRLGAGHGAINADILKRQREIEEQLNRMLKEQIGRGDLNNIPGNAAASQFSASYSDGVHTLNYSVKNGDKQLNVKDKDGKIIFDGPVNNPDDEKKIPQSVKEKYDRLVKTTRGEIRLHGLPGLLPPVPPVPPAPPAPPKAPDGPRA